MALLGVLEGLAVLVDLELKWPLTLAGLLLAPLVGHYARLKSTASSWHYLQIQATMSIHLDSEDLKFFLLGLFIQRRQSIYPYFSSILMMIIFQFLSIRPSVELSLDTCAATCFPKG